MDNASSQVGSRQTDKVGAMLEVERWSERLRQESRQEKIRVRCRVHGTGDGEATLGKVSVRNLKVS